MTVHSRARRSRGGQAMIMAVLSLTAMLGTLSFAVDVGWSYYRREAAQAAADAAAMGAVKAALITSPSGVSCGTNGVWCGNPYGTAADCPSTAPVSSANSFDTGCMLAAANGFTTSSGRRVNIEANAASSAPTVTATGITTTYYAVARVSDKPLGFFGRIMGGTLRPTARATAAILGSPGGAAGCVYVLHPTAAEAFNAGNNARLISGCGIYVNSNARGSQNNQRAMHVYGSAFVSAPAIKIVGLYGQDNGGSTNITPSTNQTATPDPFASLPAPSVGSTCQNGNFTNWQPSQYTPAPGTYCNFNLGNGMNAQLSSGIYVIKGGIFSIQGGSRLTATGGVLIYLTNGSYVNIANGTTVTLAPLSTGTYQGVLFYQDRATAATVQDSNFAGGSNMSLSGSLYFPNTRLTIDNGNRTSTIALVTSKLNIQGGATINAATSVSQTGISPGVVGTAVMIE